jgi:hypothetical protein
MPGIAGIPGLAGMADKLGIGRNVTSAPPTTVPCALATRPVTEAV